MQLLELTAAELAFVAPESDAVTDFQRRLGQRLASALTARLRMTIELHPDRAAAIVETRTAPAWRPDGALATLWLTRRLGGGRVMGQASFVPRTLIDMLDETLAECWLERPMQHETASVCAWAISAGCLQARLELHMPDRSNNPDQPNSMAQWAQGVIQRG